LAAGRGRGGLGGVRATFLLPVLVVACSKPTQATPEPPSAAPSASATATPSAAPTVDPRDAVKKIPTLAEALVAIKPKMSDTEGDISEGTVLLASWGSDRMLWADVAPKMDETSVPLVKKDPDEERGKRMCFAGFIVQIEKAGKAYSGLLMGPPPLRQIIAFYAVRSTGDLVEHKDARLCGFVIGKYDYKNSGGGSSHAIQMVGMFDLPENRLLR
jgi:hypothetical protein